MANMRAVAVLLLQLAFAPSAVLKATVASRPGQSAGASQTQTQTQTRALTRVHLVAHSHNDPGWIETEDEYYELATKGILTNVVAALEADSSRVFHWVEMVYFRRWWRAQQPGKQASVRHLVARRQLVFLTGGLCMNDEAVSHHGAVVDQMTWGHRFINATFGPEALPTVGWQIDAFGQCCGCPHPHTPFHRAHVAWPWTLTADRDPEPCPARAMMLHALARARR